VTGDDVVARSAKCVDRCPTSVIVGMLLMGRERPGGLCATRTAAK
jgi:hypothetical protein